MTRRTSDTDDAVIRHQRTSEPDMSWVQRGWRVYDRSGLRLGEIAERDDDSFVVLLDARAGSKARIPTRLVADESPEEERVTLSIGKDELDRIALPNRSGAIDA